MARIDQKKVQQLIKELRGVAVPNHQSKIWELKKDLTQEKLIGLERLLVKEYKKTRKKEHWSKELKEVLNNLYPGLHPCCFLRNIREIKMIFLGEKLMESGFELLESISKLLNNKNWKTKLNWAEKLAEIANKEVEEARQLRTKETIDLLFNNPKEFFRDDQK